MKQEEKNQQSREKIQSAAMQEFGEKGYDGASLNTLLALHGLSKGLLYHYFENKDELYLFCVRRCFDEVTLALGAVETDRSAEAVMQGYFEVRSRFFSQKPQYARIFFDALLQPPHHLHSQVLQAREGFETVNQSFFHAVLRGLKLREDVSTQDALAYFALMQSVLHIQFLSPSSLGAQWDTGAYEQQAHKAMHLLLYGVAGTAAGKDGNA